MITPKQVEAARVKEFGRLCKELEELLDSSLNKGMTNIIITYVYPSDVIEKTKERYERYGWDVRVWNSTHWQFTEKKGRQDG